MNVIWVIFCPIISTGGCSPQNTKCWEVSVNQVGWQFSQRFGPLLSPPVAWTPSVCTLSECFIWTPAPSSTATESWYGANIFIKSKLIVIPDYLTYTNQMGGKWQKIINNQHQISPNSPALSVSVSWTSFCFDEMLPWYLKLEL